MKWYECKLCKSYFQDTVKLEKPYCKYCRTLPCVSVPWTELIMTLVGLVVSVSAVAYFLYRISSL